ncbi:hypothetical protein BDY19DRAFT_907150 [Irpex rosettiformis]|uniref:Uncharacterized protein n=1 Tax=Irpex rosettiformis TaxID=378272 RepID=A0ACB8U0F1_9APHY|nr:hypothetical protein BDY19DRAFT_907150 [Irpex rosettiformis]
MHPNYKNQQANSSRIKQVGGLFAVGRVRFSPAADIAYVDPNLLERPYAYYSLIPIDEDLDNVGLTLLGYIREVIAYERTFYCIYVTSKMLGMCIVGILWFEFRGRRWGSMDAAIRLVLVNDDRERR